MKRGYKITLWAIVGIWLTAMLALTPKFISLHDETQSVQHAFDKYRTGLINHDFAQAYQFCGSSFKDATSYAEFVTAQNSLEEQYGRLSAINQTARNVDGTGTPTYWRAVIDADFVYEKKVLHFRFVFNKEDGRWLIYGGERL